MMALDLLRIPRDLDKARANMTAKLARKPLADLRFMPRSLVEKTSNYSLYRYTAAEIPQHGAPLFIVPPLAAPAIAFDLRRTCSLIEYFVNCGRPVYLVDYGPVNFSHRNLGFEHWVDTVIPEAVLRAAVDTGGDSMHVTGWSLGGIFTMFTAAAHPELPLQSVTAVASPFDLRAVPLLALARPLDAIFGKVFEGAYKTMGGMPGPINRIGFRLSSIDKYLTKPISILTHADDLDFLAQLEAVDRFMANMYAYPGRSFGQLYHAMMRTNEFATGTISIGGRPVELADIDIPVLCVAGMNDTLAPRGAVEHLLDLVTGSPSAELVEAPGGHLGVLTGRSARTTTWPAMEDFYDRHDSVPAKKKPKA